MLSFINQKGPFTEGIFRKPASIKSAIALKEKLNAGHKVNFDDEPILVVSSVLKDFLRNIQGSIFSARLYDKWLDVIDQGNEEEKITATQRLVDQLPKANVVFLRHLFGVLHNIEQHSSSSQMTAHDLSLYLTPSILCLLNSGSSAFENVSKKVTRSLILCLVGQSPHFEPEVLVLTLVNPCFKVHILITPPWSGRVLLWLGMGRCLLTENS
ncbi:rho GTPase-activating protein 20-like [Ovis aries]|uniref:rho GTPase-activating protein 20-like n=1 Tax=Ovis aries TaxID=9940 RepID=UPI0029529131|nr:rho GTPase-activating protein 20-like [Ovis aries]